LKIRVPRESHSHEHGVGLAPFGVARLGELGCEVFVQHEASRDSHFTSENYVGDGVAHLFGKSRRQRAEALIEIAHPRFRDELACAAKERRLLP